MSAHLLAFFTCLSIYGRMCQFLCSSLNSVLFICRNAYLSSRSNCLHTVNTIKYTIKFQVMYPFSVPNMCPQRDGEFKLRSYLRGSCQNPPFDDIHLLSILLLVHCCCILTAFLAGATLVTMLVPLNNII